MIQYDDSAPIYPNDPNEGKGALIWMAIGATIAIVLICNLF